MNRKKLSEHNHHLRNELSDISNRNHVLRQENEMLRLRNDMLWRLALDLRDCIRELKDEQVNDNHYPK